MPPPATTALGALYRHVTGEAHPDDYDYQPSNVTFGLFPPLEEAGSAGRRTEADAGGRSIRAETRVPKSQRRTAVADRARRDFAAWLSPNIPLHLAEKPSPLPGERAG